MIYLFGGIPAFTSLSTIECINLHAFFIPSVSSGPDESNVNKSNQLGIRKPAFKVTGIVLAVGHITFTNGCRISPIALAHPCLHKKLFLK